MANTCNKVIPHHLPTFDKAQRSHDVQQAPQLPSPSTSEESAGKKAGLETAIHFFGVFTKKGYRPCMGALSRCCQLKLPPVLQRLIFIPPVQKLTNQKFDGCEVLLIGRNPEMKDIQ